MTTSELFCYNARLFITLYKTCVK